MPDDLMTRCERRTQYRFNGVEEWQWKEIPVAEAIGSGGKSFRRKQCHGVVRIHQQHVDHGPQDHAEHLSRHDSENCMGGHYLKGEHRLSSQPVE